MGFFSTLQISFFFCLCENHVKLNITSSRVFFCTWECVWGNFPWYFHELMPSWKFVHSYCDSPFVIPHRNVAVLHTYSHFVFTQLWKHSVFLLLWILHAVSFSFQALDYDPSVHLVWGEKSLQLSFFLFRLSVCKHISISFKLSQRGYAY